MLAPLTRERIIITTALAVSDQKRSVVIALMQQAFLRFKSLQVAKVPTAQCIHKSTQELHLFCKFTME